MFLLRMLVAQEKESKLSLDRTLAAIDKVTSENIGFVASFNLPGAKLNGGG